MRRELSKAEVERLFSGAVDGALPASDAERLQSELASDAELATQYERYAKAVKLLRGQPRESAPPALASMILRRTRRRRSMLRSMRLNELQRVPVEIVVPLLLAVLVAFFLLISNP